jgi:hypothetical protein
MIQAIYIVFCLLLAYVNKRRIAYDKVINHPLNACFHLAFWIVVVIITRSWFPVAVLPFEGRLFFDTGLNIMRHLPIDYVSRTPKSYVDRFEKSVFGMDGILPKILYLIIIIVLNVIYYGR